MKKALLFFSLFLSLSLSAFELSTQKPYEALVWVGDNVMKSSDDLVLRFTTKEGVAFVFGSATANVKKSKVNFSASHIVFFTNNDAYIKTASGEVYDPSTKDMGIGGIVIDPSPTSPPDKEALKRNLNAINQVINKMESARLDAGSLLSTLQLKAKQIRQEIAGSNETNYQYQNEPYVEVPQGKRVHFDLNSSIKFD